MKPKKGIFRPLHPEKYKGDPTNIVYRSSWELKLMIELDKHPDVLMWNSEEIIIPYKSPLDNRKHRYFPDFWVKKRNKSDGKIVECLIEIKPKAQTRPPKIQTAVTKKYITEVQTWGVNSSKWKAAQDYCKSRNMDFVILTEDDLNIKYK